MWICVHEPSTQAGPRVNALEEGGGGNDECPNSIWDKRDREEFKMMGSGRALKDLGPSVGAPARSPSSVDSQRAPSLPLVRSPAVQPKPLLQ